MCGAAPALASCCGAEARSSVADGAAAATTAVLAVSLLGKGRSVGTGSAAGTGTVAAGTGGGRLGACFGTSGGATRGGVGCACAGSFNGTDGGLAAGSLSSITRATCGAVADAAGSSA